MFEQLPEAIVPVFIFFARIFDVSLGTIRIMFISKAMRTRATLIGFIEVFIWIIIVAQIFQNLDNWFNYIAYAGGFAAGTYIGMYIEEKMKMGVQIFRIIVGGDCTKLLNELQKADFRVTVVGGEGKYGPVNVLFTIAKRKKWNQLSDIVNRLAPNAFYSVEDVRQVSQLENELQFSSGQSILTRLLRLRKGF